MRTTMPETDARLSGLIRIALTGIVWGTIPLALRAADGDATVKVFYRVFFAAVVVGGWLLVSGGWRELTTLGREKLRQVALQGVLLTANWLLFLSAFEFTEVATVELLGYTGPVFVAALTPFVTGDRFDRRIVVPIALALGGIAIIMLRHGFTLGTGRQALGAALAACSALTYAGLLLRSKRLLHGISSAALMLGQYAVASLVLLPLVIYAYATGRGPHLSHHIWRARHAWSGPHRARRLPVLLGPAVGACRSCRRAHVRRAGERGSVRGAVPP